MSFRFLIHRSLVPRRSLRRRNTFERRSGFPPDQLDQSFRLATGIILSKPGPVHVHRPWLPFLESLGKTVEIAQLDARDELAPFFRRKPGDRMSRTRGIPDQNIFTIARYLDARAVITFTSDSLVKIPGVGSVYRHEKSPSTYLFRNGGLVVCNLPMQSFRALLISFADSCGLSARAYR